MHYITLDTNTWIYLANGTEPAKILNFINKEVGNGNIKILLPEIVKTEWEAHKDKTVRQGSLKHFNDITEALKKILKLLGNKGEKDFFNFLLEEDNKTDYFEDFLNEFKKKKNEILNAVNENIKLIDDLFKFNSTIITIETEIFLKAGQYALEKKAPFKGKNSFADALIILSFFDYVKKNNIEGAIFITYNTEDFCEKKDGKKILHPDFIEDFTETKSQFYTIVGEAINSIENDIVTKEEIERIRELQENDWNDDVEFCEICKENDQRLNSVNFYNTTEINDERITEKFIDKNQTELDFQEDIPRRNIIQYKIDSIEIGNCSWCNSLHFKCVDCEHVNAVWEGEYNSDKECDYCGLNYIITRQVSRDGNYELEFTIPKETITCQKCSNEFYDFNSGLDICEDCENDYGYGEK